MVPIVNLKLLRDPKDSNHCGNCHHITCLCTSIDALPTQSGACIAPETNTSDWPGKKTAYEDSTVTQWAQVEPAGVRNLTLPQGQLQSRL